MISVLTLCVVVGVAADGLTFGAYFANWAQYHAGQYKYTADKVSPIADKVDDILYSFIYFCPPAGTSPMPYWAKAPYGHCDDSTEYQLLSVEPKDNSFIPALKAMHPKLLLSIGGWNFPSAYFSKMVASSAARTKFVNSAKSWVSQHNADGIDIDWEYPCSEARTDSVKITCELFRTVQDEGGKCPDDTNNLPIFLQELKAALPGKLITVASQAGIPHADQMNLVKSAEHIDYFNVMTYDYTVSDIAGDAGAHFNPNCPLYNPKAGEGTTQMSINYTISHYLKVGVPANKIRVGIPFYAHTWYATSLSGDDWKTWGTKGEVQGQCCGPFKSTYGGKFGKGCQQCGTMMYSEIEAAKPQNTVFDTVSQSDIGYFTSKGADGYTDKGIWISYNDVKSMQAIVEYTKKLNLAGVFIFDTSMDSMEGGQFTYKLMKTIATALGK